MYDENVLIHLEDFTMAYTDRPVIWDIDLDIYEGSITAIIGPNGAGKSTLMKGILGLMKPISGKVSIMGKSYKEVYKHIAYIPQTNTVNWDFPTTVLDVVTMGRYNHLGLLKRVNKREEEDTALRKIRRPTCFCSFSFYGYSILPKMSGLLSSSEESPLPQWRARR